MLEHALENFAAIFSVFFFGGTLKTFGVTSFFEICKSHLNLLPYSASRNSTIIADKLMKFAGHLYYPTNVGGKRLIHRRFLLYLMSQILLLLSTTTEYPQPNDILFQAKDKKFLR